MNSCLDLQLVKLVLSEIRQAKQRCFSSWIVAAVIAVTISFAFQSCKTVCPTVDIGYQTMRDSGYIELEKKYSAKVEECSNLAEHIASLNATLTNATNQSTNETTTIERYDSTGLVTEKIVTEKTSSTIIELRSEIFEYRQSIESLMSVIGSQSLEIDSLSAMVSEIENLDTQTVIEKKIVPTWCWMILLADVCLLCFYLVRLLRKLHLI